MKRALVLGMEHTFLVGVEYGHQTRDTVRFNGTADPVSLIDPVLTPPQYSAIAGTDNEFRGSVAAGYVQDQIAIAPKWKAMVGARYDYFDQFLHDRRPAAEDLGRIDREWSPRAGLVYQPWFPVSFYGSFSRSFQPSGEGLSLATNNQELGPETTRNLEAGMKMELFRRALNTTVSVFNLQRNNIKTVDPLDPTQLVLAGKQRTNGVEISFNGRLGTNLDVYGGYAWLDGKILESNSLSAGVPIEGKRAGSVPLHSGNIWATYRFGSGFGFGGGVIYNDDRYVANDNTVTLPAFTRVDATLFWRKQHYDFAVNVRNLGNIRYYETAHANSQIYPGAHINATVTTRFRW
jgi:catecholate siderophore receptor